MAKPKGAPTSAAVSVKTIQLNQSGLCLNPRLLELWLPSNPANVETVSLTKASGMPHTNAIKGTVNKPIQVKQQFNADNQCHSTNQPVAC